MTQSTSIVGTRCMYNITTLFQEILPKTLWQNHDFYRQSYFTKPCVYVWIYIYVSMKRIKKMLVFFNYVFIQWNYFNRIRMLITKVIKMTISMYQLFLTNGITTVLFIGFVYILIVLKR